MRGDIDGNGKITQNDRKQISEHLGGTITLTGADSWCAKVAGNNEISVSDLVQLMQYLEGKTNNLTGTPTFADYYNNWTYHKVDDLTGYWTAEIAINGLKVTSDAIVNIGNDEGIFYKSELSDGAIRFYVTRPPIAEVSATITFKPGTGVITTSYESAKFHAATHSKDGADPITPESIGALSLSGGTMTGSLILNGDPAKDLEAATKQYVDNHMTYESGLPEKPSTPIADGQEIPYTWEEINAITLAGKAQEYFSLGATKLVNLSTAVLGANAATMMVIGFNQDGENTTTFQTKGTLPTDIAFGSSAVWIGSTARIQCQNFYNACEAKSFIKTVSKGTCLDQVSGKNGTATYNDETVWIPSETEIGLDKYSSLTKSNSTSSNSECTKGYNATYSYYTSDTTRIKYQMNANGSLTTTAIWHWERSRYYGYSDWPCIVRSDGQPDRRDYDGSNGLAPAFVIGNGTFSAKITQDGEDITDKVKGLITSDTVLYTPQTLTDGQKTQARTNINAAPAGFGLGETNGCPIDPSVEGGLNTAIKCGWYYFGGSGTVANAPSIPNGGYGSLLVTSRGADNTITQMCFFETYTTIAIRYRFGSEWQPWEYINPPMSVGVEYRTTERYLGKPVYVKTVNTGALPNATYKEISASFPNANRFLAIYGLAYKDNAHLIPLPCLRYGSDAYNTDHAVQVTVNTTTSIIISTNRDMSSFTESSVCVKYTKSTD